MLAVRFLRRNGDKIAKKQVVEAPRNRLKRVGGRPDLKFNETAKVMPKKKVPLAVSKKMAVAKMKHMNLKHMKLSKVPLAVFKKMAVAKMKAMKAAAAVREAEARQAALEALWRTHSVWVSQAAFSESS